MRRLCILLACVALTGCATRRAAYPLPRMVDPVTEEQPHVRFN